MAELAGSLYLFSTAAFAVITMVVGVRLLLLWRRTGQLAELLLGIGLPLNASLGYGLVIAGLVGRAFTDDPANAPFHTAVTTAGWVFHNLGVFCVLAFVVHVFHPGSRWAKAIVGVAMAMLWTGWIAYLVGGGMRDGQPRGGYWLMFAVIGSYPMWGGCESLVYWRRMKRRVALDLAEPLVANRFLLWFLASVSAVASIWIVHLPGFLGYVPNAPETQAATALSMLATSLLGTASVSIYWLTFFPPRWYRALFGRTAAPS